MRAWCGASSKTLTTHTVQVNDEDYSGIEAAGPAILLQLLRLWLQQFHPALLAGWATAGHTAAGGAAAEGEPAQERSGSHLAAVQAVRQLSGLQLQLLSCLVSSLRPVVAVREDMQGPEGLPQSQEAPTAQPEQGSAMTPQTVSEQQSTDLRARLRSDQPLLQWLAPALLGADSPLGQLAALQQVLLDCCADASLLQSTCGTDSVRHKRPRGPSA